MCSSDLSREDLINTNKNIVATVTKEIMATSPDAFLIIVSNPLDAMCYVAKKVSGFPRKRVMGMAGILDTARYRCFIAMELGWRWRKSRPWSWGATATTWCRW